MAKKKDQIRELVKESIKEEMRESGVIEETSEENPIIPTEDLPESVKPLLASFPSAEGYYGKIYKIKPDGDWQTMDYRIESPETIPDGDLEGEVRRTIKQKKWGNGDYRVQIRRQGERTLYLNKKVVIDESVTEQAERSPIREQLGMLRETLEITERLKPIPLNPESFGNTILKAVEAGRSMAEPKGGNGPDSQLSLIIQLAEKFLPALTNKPDIDTIVEKVVARLPPQQNPIEMMAKFKETLGFKFAHEVKEPKEDALDSVNKVTGIIQAISPLVNPNTSPPSWGQLLLEHGAKLLEPIISTLKEFAEAKKMEMQLRIQGLGGQPALIERTPTISLPGPTPGGTHPLHPFVTRTLKAANENDESYFDNLRQRIYAMGPQFIDGLITGELTVDFAIEIANEVYGLPIDTPNLKPYFDKFVDWLKQNYGEESIEPDIPTVQSPS